MSDVSEVADYATAIGVPLAVSQLLIAYLLYRMQCLRENRRATLDYYESKEQSIKTLRRQLKESYGEILDAESAARLHGNKEDNIAARRLLNILDRLAVGVDTEVLCFTTIHRMCGGIIVSTDKRLRAYVDLVSRKENRAVWVEFQALVKRLQRADKKRKGLVERPLAASDAVVPASPTGRPDS